MAETLTAVVTGAASGIGRALAEALHAKGARLVRTGMSPEGVDPALVAGDAPRAIDDGVFAVVPSQWRAAVVAQSERMVSGNGPHLRRQRPAQHDQGPVHMEGGGLSRKSRAALHGLSPGEWAGQKF